jgi:hypothetical protein
MRWLCCLIALITVPRIAAAQDTAQPLQDLFFTEVVYPQDKGEAQFTFATLMDRSEPGTAVLVPFSVEYGLTGRWQIQGGWDGYERLQEGVATRLRTARFSIGTKYSLMHVAGSRMHAAFGVDVEFPHASSFAPDEGEDAIDIEPFLALAADVGKHVTLFGSATASWAPHDVAALVTDAIRPPDPGTLSVGALVAVRRVTLATEYTNRSDELPWRLDGAALLTPSLVVHPAHKFEIAVGAPIGIDAGDHQPGIVAHVIREF